MESDRTRHWVFTDRPRRTGREIRSPALPWYPLYLGLIPFQRRHQCQIEKKTLSRAEAGVPSFECFAAKIFIQLLEYYPVPLPPVEPINRLLANELPFGLGPSHSRRNKLHVKPFSTSVHKVFICVFATNTKICTIVSFTPGLRLGLRC